MVKDTPLRIVDFLTNDQRLELRKLGSPVSFPPDQVVFREGQPSHSVLIIDKGNVKVSQQASDGSEVILAVRGEDDLVIGDEGVLMGEPRSASMTTISEVVGLDIRADKLLRFVEENRLWPIMYRAAVLRRRESDQRALLERLDVPRRLARWLLELADEVGEKTEDGWVIETTLSQRDMASRIGASRDAVAIALRKLRDKELVTTGRHRIVLHDLRELRRIALES